MAWKQDQLAYSTDRAVAFLRRKNAAGVASEIIIQPIAIELIQRGMTTDAADLHGTA